MTPSLGPANREDELIAMRTARTLRKAPHCHTLCRGWVYENLSRYDRREHDANKPGTLAPGATSGDGGQGGGEPVADLTFDEFFSLAHARGVDGLPAEPYEYQRGLAADGLPELLAVPTGTGKTAAATLPHLYRLLEHPDESIRASTPRRLVIVMPQRTLVEQTVLAVETWLQNLGRHDVGLHVLMGGASTSDRAWKLEPQRPAVIVGTQDMVLSRLLMRGYGESQGSWPISFGLLHADTQFVFDEVQLMGPALPTSLQLDGLRHLLGAIGHTKSMWMSATVHAERLVTFDRPVPPTAVCLTEADRSGPLARRLDATRTVRELDLGEDQDRFTVTAAAVIRRHQPATRTIVVLNTVPRARDTYEAIARTGTLADVVLVHSRFRPGDRATHLASAQQEPGPHGTIVVTTQVLEAGVDMSARVLFTETAPWSSVTQRAGRCNRAGEYEHGLAELWWFDPPTTRDGSLPYDEADIAATTNALRAREGAEVTSTDLSQPVVAEVEVLHPVLRRTDLLDLFDTNPDLSGNLTDVSRWVRDADDRTVEIAWRRTSTIDGELVPDDAGRLPGRDELCPAPVHEARKFVSMGKAFTFDVTESRWRGVRESDIRPGALIVADASTGGYNPKTGWSPGSKAPVEPVATDGVATSGLAEDRGSALGTWITLEQHLADTRSAAARLIDELVPLPGLSDDLAHVAIEAALWHDLGKAHPTFVERLAKVEPPPDPSMVYAKSPALGPRPRATFRHEFASALMLMEREDLTSGVTNPFLLIYLVAAHHGKVRMTIRSARSDAGRGSVLGISEGDRTRSTPSPVDGDPLEPIELHLGRIGLGATASGASWQHRATQLRDEFGPFRLAFLEALVRMADWHASAALPAEVEP